MFFFLFLAFVIFSGALSAAAYYVWAVPQQKANAALSGRLRELRRTGGVPRTAGSPDLLRREHQGRLGPLGDFFEWVGLLRRLQEWIDQANLKQRATEVFALCLGIAVIVYLVFGLLGMNLLVLRIAVALGLGSIPVVRILFVRGKRLRQFEEKLPEAIDLFNRSMKAGHNIHSGLETIARETSDPIRMEFRKVVEELGLGNPLEQALHNMGRRVPIIDLKFLITGLILQRQTGANMVDVLDNLAALVRERLNLMAKIKSHTAQQRFSAGLMCIIPVVFALGSYITNPQHIRVLWTDPTGQAFLTYAIISELIGILIIRKIANPKF